MDEAISHLIALLDIPQVWGALLTILIVSIGFILKRAIEHTFQSHREENIFIRGLYEDLKDYVTEQAHALRDSYLIIFEPESSSIDVIDCNIDKRLEIAEQRIMNPFRRNIVSADAETKSKIYEIHTSIIKYKARYKDSKSADEINAEKEDFFKKTDECINFIRVDKLAQRLGLIRKSLGK